MSFVNNTRMTPLAGLGFVLRGYEGTKLPVFPLSRVSGMWATESSRVFPCSILSFTKYRIPVPTFESTEVTGLSSTFVYFTDRPLPHFTCTEWRSLLGTSYIRVPKGQKVKNFISVFRLKNTFWRPTVGRVINRTWFVLDGYPVYTGRSNTGDKRIFPVSCVTPRVISG